MANTTFSSSPPCLTLPEGKTKFIWEQQNLNFVLLMLIASTWPKAKSHGLDTVRPSLSREFAARSPRLDGFRPCSACDSKTSPRILRSRHEKTKSMNPEEFRHENTIRIMLAASHGIRIPQKYHYIIIMQRRPTSNQDSPKVIVLQSCLEASSVPGFLSTSTSPFLNLYSRMIIDDI